MDATEVALRDLLGDARSTVSYYRSLGELDQSDDAIAAMTRIRPLARDDVQRERARLVSGEGERSGWRSVRTTGTSGQPIEVIVDQGARDVERDVLAGHIDRVLTTVDWRRNDIVHLALHSGASSVSTPSPWNPSARFRKWNLLRVSEASPDQFIASLRHLDATVVTTMPSVAHIVVSRIAQMREAVRVQPHLVILSGEQAEPGLRDQIQRILGAPVTSLYTMAEAGIVASACATTDGYHAEPRSCFVEIVDALGRPSPPGEIGEILVTPLANRAMPLLRYRTGDVGSWGGRNCECGREQPWFHLEGRQSDASPGNDSSQPFPRRFAKIVAGFNVKRLALTSAGEGRVEVMYESDEPLGAAEHSLIVRAVREDAGPATEVTFRHHLRFSGSSFEGSAYTELAPGPSDASPSTLRDWLQEQLESRPSLLSAVLTGSALDPDSTTRFSDIDLILLVTSPPDASEWLELARDLRKRIPRLRMNVDRADTLAERAPLLVCRMHCEQLPVCGRDLREVIPWPARSDLTREATFWRQNAIATLWTRLADRDACERDPVFDAWIALRAGVDALRYRYTRSGRRTTRTSEVLRLARSESADLAFLPDLEEAADVAREFRPPPPASDGRADAYLGAALAAARRCT